MPIVTCHYLDEWDDYPLAKLLACAYSAPGRYPELRGLRDALRALVPTELPIQKVGFVIVKPGEGANIHSHNRTFAVAYCIQPGHPAAALVVDGTRYIPQRGSVTVINPGVPHSIELNEGEIDRVSFVILVGDDPKRLAIDE